MGKEPKLTKCCEIPKGWGRELVIHNCHKYCGKILEFRAGCRFSMHYHMVKQETWFVRVGEFIFNWIDTERGVEHTRSLAPGDVVEIPTGMPHQLHALTDGEIIEVSTEHFDHDSYRIKKGN